MPSSPPPNEALVELASVLGEDNVRTLVRTFLRDFPASLKELSGGDRRNRHRIAHSLKSNARLMGAFVLSDRMAKLEERLAEEGGGDLVPQDLVAIKADFDQIAGSLRG
ncbi:MAG: Hpt domain-containing protein, partial [Verrucomicrobiales bacterium]